MRRNAARNLRRAGVDKFTAMKVLGHKTESMFKRYAIDDDKDLRDAALRLDGYLAAQPKGKRTGVV